MTRALLDRLGVLTLVVALGAAWWRWDCREEQRLELERARLMVEAHAVDTAYRLGSLVVGGD